MRVAACCSRARISSETTAAAYHVVLLHEARDGAGEEVFSKGVMIFRAVCATISVNFEFARNTTLEKEKNSRKKATQEINPGELP